MGSRIVYVNIQEAHNVVNEMPSYVPQLPSSASMGIEGSAVHHSHMSEFGTFEQSLGFRVDDAINLSRNPIFNQMKSNSQVLGGDVQFGALSKISSLASSDKNLSAAIVASQTLPLQKDTQPNLASTSAGPHQNWGESNIADASPRTDTSTDDTDSKNQTPERGHLAIAVSDSNDRSKAKSDQKTLRRLAQNREAARKSRLRKKAYVQQLESSRLKLTQLEQELQRAHQQGICISSAEDQSNSLSANGINREP